MHNIFLLLFFFSTFGFSQTKEYENVLSTFQGYYNEGKVESIFNMMTPSMQESLTFENVNRIITSFRNHLGKLEAFQYKENEGTTEIYIATFEKGKQIIKLVLSEEGKIQGLRFLPINDLNETAKIDRNITKFQLPFKGNWLTYWGGDTKAQNYHVISNTQKHAFDFLMLGKNNKSYERSGTRNEDYFAFGKPLFAVCDATVITVIDGVPDNKPGAMNPSQSTGNTVILKTSNNEYIVYAHFENETIKVKEGDSVLKGQYLGNCGNSGNSSEPHLHLHVQDGPNLMTSIGVKCYFEALVVNNEFKTDYSPVRLDRISRPE
jgi:murein DD-endopeptidase MepM/ murein hydrolase activator NlpD